MAMTRQLHAISALATELGRDRRTIASALSSVPPDGMKGPHRAWYMQTAIDALNGTRRLPTEGTFVGHLCARLDGWQEIHGGDKSAGRFPIDQAAELLGVDRAAVLTWLRAGMPFSTEGDWRTGEGFELALAWAIDWVALVHGLAAHQGVESAARRRLRLP